MTRRDWLFVLLVIVVAGATIRLGIWQLDRLGERRERNARIQANIDRNPLDLRRAPSELSPPSEYLPATAQGTFDYQHTFVLLSRSLNGQAGVHLVTPFFIQGTPEAILVDRGWIPYQDRTEDQRGRYQVAGTVQISGYLRLPEQRSLFTRLEGGDARSFRSISIERMGAQIRYPLLPYYLQQSAKIPGAGLQPEPAAEMDLSEGPHFGYALQWFAFAAIALGGGAYWLYRKLRPAARQASE